MEIVDNCCTIDLTEVDSKNALGLKNEFYISFRKGFVPKTAEGAELSLYETKQEFATYKLTRTGGKQISIQY